MNPIFAAALEVQAACREEGLRFCFIGWLAVQRWGEPRLSVDVDLTVSTVLGEEERVVDALLRRFRPRLEDARSFALRNRVVLLESAGGVPVDASLGAIPFEQRMLDRSSAYLFNRRAVEGVMAGFLGKRGVTSARATAQDLIYEAWDSSGERRIELALRALETDSDWRRPAASGRQARFDASEVL